MQIFAISDGIELHVRNETIGAAEEGLRIAGNNQFNASEIRRSVQRQHHNSGGNARR
jgi:hypothetical protein